MLGCARSSEDPSLTAALGSRSIQAQIRYLNCIKLSRFHVIVNGGRFVSEGLRPFREGTGLPLKDLSLSEIGFVREGKTIFRVEAAHVLCELRRGFERTLGPEDW